MEAAAVEISEKLFHLFEVRRLNLGAADGPSSPYASRRVVRQCP